MKFHPNVLGSKQRKLLRKLGPAASGLGFYLAGGTALALQLGHRTSVDFDWFIEKSSLEPLVLAGDLRDGGFEITGQTTQRATLHATISGVSVSFIEYPYAPLGPFVEWPAFGCRLASLEDIACMKLSAISQRGTKRDFVDVHALCTNFKPLPELLDSYRARYRVKEMSHVLYGLAYFDDAEKDDMPPMLRKTEWRTVKKAVTAWVAAAR